MKSVDCVHVIQQKDTASSPSAPPGAVSGTTGLFSVTFLWLAMLLSSCLAAVSLYHVIILKTELEALRSELIYSIQARSKLDQPLVSPDERKAGTPVSPFLQVSATGSAQVSWRDGFCLAGHGEMWGCSHWLWLLLVRREGLLVLAQLRVSRRKSGTGVGTGAGGLLSTQKKKVNTSWGSGLGCHSGILSGENQEYTIHVFFLLSVDLWSQRPFWFSKLLVDEWR